MEEDELGTLRELRHRAYVTCVRCGQPVPQENAVIVQGDALEDQSEFQYLCQSCQEQLASGEQDLPAAEV